MKPPIRPLTPDTSLSTSTVKSGHSDSVLALGKKLVAELDTGERIDTLCRWMSHWIAELMRSAEVAQGEEHYKRAAECADAIMKLWTHRNMLVDGKRPLESFEPVLRTLESLDPQSKRHRYFSPPESLGQSTDSSPPKKWLDCAKRTDTTARALVKYCLTKAAEIALDGKEEWVTLAQSVLTDSDDDLRIIIKMFNDTKASEASAVGDESKKEIETRIEDLNNLIELSQLEIAELKSSIDSNKS